ncbi:hypothetical protein [Lactiplantibacillus plantarum]|uniref:hypothetical protein n=1 Tax=Lactiplantibacillus plantarum TaxID=1590 RepID=UPI003B67495D
MTDTEYAKAIQAKVTMANLEINAALTTEQQAQIGQDFIADIAELSERGIGRVHIERKVGYETI